MRHQVASLLTPQGGCATVLTPLTMHSALPTARTDLLVWPPMLPAATVYLARCLAPAGLHLVSNGGRCLDLLSVVDCRTGMSPGVQSLSTGDKS